MTSPLCVATGGWCRRVFHYRPPTPMYRNSPPLCTIVLQIPSLMPLKMRKVQPRPDALRPGRSDGKAVLQYPRHLRRVRSRSFRMRTRKGIAIARARGKLHGKQPKLSVGQQRELCRMHATGEYSISDLAELFSVSRPTAYRTLNRCHFP